MKEAMKGAKAWWKIFNIEISVTTLQYTLIYVVLGLFLLFDVAHYLELLYPVYVESLYGKNLVEMYGMSIPALFLFFGVYVGTLISEFRFKLLFWSFSCVFFILILLFEGIIHDIVQINFTTLQEFFVHFMMGNLKFDCLVYAGLLLFYFNWIRNGRRHWILFTYVIFLFLYYVLLGGDIHSNKLCTSTLCVEFFISGFHSILFLLHLWALVYMKCKFLKSSKISVKI